MNKKIYLSIAVFMFMMEGAILKFWSMNKVIRGTIGDVIAVIFLYSLIMGVIKIERKKAVIISFCTGALLEVLQYMKFAEIIGMGDNRVFTTIFGSNFDWKDIGAYFVGAVVAICCELTATKIRDGINKED